MVSAAIIAAAIPAIYWRTIAIDVLPIIALIIPMMPILAVAAPACIRWQRTQYDEQNDE